MADQVHETCEPIRPEDVPDEIVAAAQRYDLQNRGRGGWTKVYDAQVRRLLAGALTEAGERIAQAVECELTDDLGDMLVVTVEGQRAAAVIRSWPEALDA